MSRFYETAGRSLPHVEAIDDDALPAAVRPLLIHDETMTRRLEQRAAAPVGLRVLARVLEGAEYARHVVLTRAHDGAGLVLAAVMLRLDRLPPSARHAVLAERTPLGHILDDSGAVAARRHEGCLRVRPDALVRDALAVGGAPWVYGRRVRLTARDGAPLAEVVELVAPDGAARGGRPPIRT